ncbi:hypothetical protein, partial [Microbulbifer thermotolerans]|uniref:hypothetical protein n=1 Tax=Microbulbifer thermotolerans TaxID=252514 RepID=UPI00224A772B
APFGNSGLNMQSLSIKFSIDGCPILNCRKIPASLLPTLVNLFSVSLEQLLGMEKMPAKRGPASALQRQIEQISRMPRNRQKMIAEVLEALIKQQSA